ncbi:MFS transporter [Enterococcus sp. AZ196]|uniref:MFS transporter n=1 Tax=Enterococcus sp. AZ196 TaxID=2774659 RepID=UPI003D2BC02E
MQTSLKVKIGIFSLSMLSMATLLMSPVLGLIVEAFPNSGISQIQMILSVANLTGIVAAFVVGRIALSIPKRTIALIGSAMTCIFGLIPYFFHSQLLVLIICSGLIGVSVGFITNVIPGLIADYFSVEERQGAMGKQVSFVSIGTMLLMFISGNLGANIWYHSYLSYIFAGIVFVIAWVCLPKSNIEEKQEQKGNHSVTEVINKRVVIVALMGFCFMVVNNAFNNNISLLIIENNLGGSDVSGLVTMLAQLGGLATGLCVGRISKVIKSHMVAFAFVIEGVSLVILAIAGNLPLAIIGSFLSGAGQALFFSQAPFLITILVHPVLIPMGMAVLSTANSIGGFLSPAIINFLNHTLLGSTASGAMLVGCVISIIVAAVAILSNFQKKSMSHLEQEKV